MKKILHKWIERYLGTEEALLLTVILVLSLVILATMGSILGPVFAAVILSFLLQGLVNTLRRYGVSNRMAISGTFLLFMVGFLSVLIGLIPMIGRQTSLLVGELPGMILRLRDLAADLPERYAEYVSPEQFRQLWRGYRRRPAPRGTGFILSISSFPSLIALMVYVVLVPLLVCFMLRTRTSCFYF